MKKQFLIAITSSVLTLGIFFAMQYIFAWTNPTLNPPSGNVSPPINEGTTAQVKDGSLGVAGNFIAGGLSSFSQIEFGGEIKDSWPSGDTIPSGAIMAFNLSSCPSGWSELTSARGRVIVGLNPSDGSFDLKGETGGEKAHALTIAEMPSHDHQTALVHSGSIAYGVGSNVYGIQGSSLYTRLSTLTSDTGGSQSHNNLQPYISFIYCQKN